MDEEQSYCGDCQTKYYGDKNGMTNKLDYWKQRMIQLSQTAPEIIPNTLPKTTDPSVQLSLLTFEELKQKEKTAQKWLLENKGKPNWKQARDKYHLIVKHLSVKGEH